MVTDKALIHNPFAVAVQKEYLVCIVWADFIAQGACLPPMVLVPAPGVTSILAAADG